VGEYKAHFDWLIRENSKEEMMVIDWVICGCDGDEMFCSVNYLK